MHSIREVILDIDGTLVDSNDAHTRAWQEALARRGFDIQYEKIRSLIGKGGDKLLPEVSGLRDDSAEGKEISRLRGEIFTSRYLPELEAFPGTRELLLRMRTDGIRLMVASSAKEDELKALLKIARADDLIERKTSSDDAEDSKPDPDIVEAALSRAAHPRERILMIGDTPYDIEAANRAGIECIAFRSGGWRDAHLTGALAIYDGPADLLKQYDSSPLGKNKAS